jgi:Rrf2 family iron-sulfur cluster assembly transcriptional regulator
MKLLTKDTRYALRAVAFMARESTSVRPRFTVDQIATAEHIPRLYLRKLLQVLARHRILDSHKGKQGGFSLLQLPQRITMADIVTIFQGELDSVDCHIGNHVCQNSELCILSNKMRNIYRNVEKEFSKITIASLLRKKRSLS